MATSTPQRGWRSRLQHFINSLRPALPQGIFPVRLRPARIEMREAYRYTLTAGPEPRYPRAAVEQKGEIQIDLPLDDLAAESHADVEALAAQEAGAIEGRYGWLAFSRAERTDLAQRLNALVPEWENPTHFAFPLNTLLLREETAHLWQRVEQGEVEEEHLFYTPESPVQFPFVLNMTLSADSATPNRPEGSFGNPTLAANEQMALHVELEVVLARPKTVTEENSRITLDTFLLFWPAPIASEDFTLADSSGTLTLDSRQNQLAIGGLILQLASTGRGPLRATTAFRLIVHSPAALQRATELKGMFKVTGHNITLSGVRAQFFDGAGYLQTTNRRGKALIEYHTELVTHFTLPLANAQVQAPRSLERRFSWVSATGNGDPLPLVLQELRDAGFTLAPAIEQPLWRATRTADGKALTLDVYFQQKEIAHPFPNSPDGFAPTTQLYQHYDLHLRAHYRGAWAVVQEIIGTIEERLKSRLLPRGER